MMKTRAEKIDTLKSILSGKKSPADFVQKKIFHWWRDEAAGPYRLSNPEPGESKTEFTKEEYRAYCASKPSKHLHIVHVAQEGNDPLPAE